MTDLDPDAQMMARHNDALAVERLINAARDKAKIEERAAIVAWLRRYPKSVTSAHDWKLANAIEAGEHLK